jgi:chromosome segregation ATPase
LPTYEERQTAALANTVAWLEDELRETRAGIAKLAQALEQSQSQQWEQSAHLRRVEDAVAALTPQLSAIPDIDGQVRQLKDVIAGVHEQGLATGSRLSDLTRLVEGAAERERQVLNELTHRLDAVERQTQSADTRFTTIDDAGRRAMESLTVLRQRSDEVARAVDVLEGRLARVVESGNRTEHEFTRIGGEIDGLHKRDEAISERVQIYTEMIKRLEGQISRVAADVAVKQDVLEKIDLGRVETHRLEERISLLEAAADTIRDQDEELLRQITLLEGRQKGYQDRLNGLLGDFAAYRERVNDQFQRLHQVQERLKRRQIDELERELRELRVNAFRPTEEP